MHRTPAPLAYTDDLYNFREHVELVRRRITQRLGAPLSADAPAQEIA